MSAQPQLALIALNTLTPPSAERVLEELAAMFPDVASARCTSRTATAATFVAGEATINYTMVDRPIPWQHLEGPCATAWYWPEAEAALKPHCGHVILTLLDENKVRLQRTQHLTRWACAVSAACEAAGIVWGASGMVHEPAAFRQLALASKPDDLPLNLWIDFRVVEEQGGYRLFTTGLEALGHREFEVPHFVGDPQALAAHIYNVTHYVLEKGPILKSGEAVGLPNGAQVNVDMAESLIDLNQEVIRLTFES